MSDTSGGWNPQDPYGQQPRQQPSPPSQEPGPFDPYGPRDPYGRPANPYGRPDYEPWRPPVGPPAPDALPVYPAGPGTGDAWPGHAPAVPPERAAQPHQPATVGAAWRWAWASFGRSWGRWVVLTLLVGGAQLAVGLVFSPSTLDAFRNAGDPAAVAAAQAAGQTVDAKALAATGTAIGFLFQALLYAGAVAATYRRQVAVRDYFVLRGFGGLLCYALIAGALGFVGTAVPMVGWLVQVVFVLLLLPVPYLLLDGAGLGAAFGRGIGLVLGHLPAALGVYAIGAGLVVASVVTCGLGLIVAVPVMLLLGAYLVQRWTDRPVYPATER